MKFSVILVGCFCVAMLTQCNKTPDMDFSSIEYTDGGETKSVEVGNGQKTVVHFYASWCGDCKREMPDANEVLSNAPEGMRIYYLTDDSPERKLAMEEKYNIPFPTYQLKGSLKSAGAHFIPLTYFIDENGKQVIAQAEQIDWHSDEIKTFLGY
jgi:thiol-disulfide isomerase/thioredoxin